MTYKKNDMANLKLKTLTLFLGDIYMSLTQNVLHRLRKNFITLPN